MFWYLNSGKSTLSKWRLKIIKWKIWKRLRIKIWSRDHQKTISSRKKNHKAKIKNMFLRNGWIYWVKNSRIKMFFQGKCQVKNSENLIITFSRHKNRLHKRSINKFCTLPFLWFQLELYAPWFTSFLLKSIRYFVISQQSESCSFWFSFKCVINPSWFHQFIAITTRPNYHIKNKPKYISLFCHTITPFRMDWSFVSWWSIYFSVL